MDDDQLDLSPGDNVSSDEETIKGDRDQEHIAEVLEEERQEDAAAPAPENHGPLANRYRQLLRDQDDTSDSGSAEGLPKRVGSPIDSLLSVPDDTHSVQVSKTCYSSNKERMG